MSYCPPIVLTFAASDPTGGAGLQADVLTLAGMGCHPLSVLTALTVQDTCGVEGVYPVEPDRVRAQAELVLASGRGEPLSDDAMLEALCAELVPQSTVMTPNSIEAHRLGGAPRLLAAGCEYVLITGTHDPGEQVHNRLYDGGGLVREDRWPRLPGSYHGSGCTLASAIAAALANGLGVPEAVRDAQEYTWQTLAAGFRPGAGQHIPDRFFWSREAAKE